MCCLLVSGFLTEITQQIHSLRASGVMSSHFARAAGSEMRTFRKSAGTLCTAQGEIAFLVIDFLSTHTHSVLISCVHAPKQFTHGNAESAANGQQAFESPPKLDGGGILFLRQSSENLGVYCRKYYARVRIADQRFL